MPKLSCRIPHTYLQSADKAAHVDVPQMQPRMAAAISSANKCKFETSGQCCFVKEYSQTPIILNYCAKNPARGSCNRSKTKRLIYSTSSFITFYRLNQTYPQKITKTLHCIDHTALNLACIQPPSLDSQNALIDHMHRLH